MAYIELINDLNKELASNGIESIYDLLVKNKGYEDILKLLESNTNIYNNLTESEKKSFQKHIKFLHIQKKMLFN